MSGENPILKRVYSLGGDRTETREVYGAWAKSYDKDTKEGMGYVAPALAAAVLAKLIADDAIVLDAGCGTGLVAVELAKHSGAQIDGFDLTKEMLETAAEKGLYGKLFEADMTKPLDIADNAYDGVICVGVLTAGHVGPDGLDELVRVAKPGAPIVFTVHEKVWEEQSYPDKLAALEQAGLVKISATEEAAYHEKAGYRCRLCVLEAI